MLVEDETFLILSQKKTYTRIFLMIYFNYQFLRIHRTQLFNKIKRNKYAKNRLRHSNVPKVLKKYFVADDTAVV